MKTRKQVQDDLESVGVPTDAAKYAAERRITYEYKHTALIVDELNNGHSLTKNPEPTIFNHAIQYWKDVANRLMRKTHSGVK